MYEIRHAVTNEVVSVHKTKKAAVAQAEEMTAAHKAIDAMAFGQPVSFTVEKAAEEPLPVFSELQA